VRTSSFTLFIHIHIISVLHPRGKQTLMPSSHLSCLDLWRDTGLVRALDLSKELLSAVDTLNALWPCLGAFCARAISSSVAVLILGARSSAEFRHQGSALRERLEKACAAAAVPPPALPVQLFAPLIMERPLPLAQL
jgi:hypothetical protein